LKQSAETIARYDREFNMDSKAAAWSA